MKSGSNSALSLATAQAKALKLFDMVKQHCDKGSKDEKFNASKDWFMHFKGSDALHNIRMQDEAAVLRWQFQKAEVFCSEVSKRSLHTNTHASHGVICARNKTAAKLILLSQFL